MFNIAWSEYQDVIVSGLLTTLRYTAVSFLGAFALGLVVALARLSRFPITRAVAATYTEVFKNVPLLAVIFVTYFGLATIEIRLDAFTAGCVSLVLFYAAYLAEIFRAGFAGIPVGQTEVSLALGFSRHSTQFRVVLPQALRAALPGTNTMLVDLLKSTSLLVTIAAAELMTEAQLIASSTFQALEVYVVIAGLYFAMCYPLSQVLLRLERRLAAGRPLSPRRAARLRRAAALLTQSDTAAVEVAR